MQCIPRVYKMTLFFTLGQATLFQIIQFFHSNHYAPSIHFASYEELHLLALLLNRNLERLTSQAIFAEVKTNIVHRFIIL